MIKEDYVSYEVAKLLKEKGFEINTTFYYNSDGEKYRNYQNVTGYKGYYSCPTHQMAMKWLREKGYHIVIFTDSPRYEVKIQDLNDGGFNVSGITRTFNTYEEAVGAALKYCLTNLINNETN